MTSSVRITSLPASHNAVSRVGQANSMRELFELLPIEACGEMVPVLEQCYRIAQKSAAIAATVKEFKAHEASKTLPAQIPARSYKVQVCKEFWGSGALRSAEEALNEDLAYHAKKLLAHHIKIKEAEHAHFQKLGAPARWKPAVKTAASNAISRETTAGFIIEEGAPDPTVESSRELETYLLAFPPRAFALGDASVHRDLCRKMKKMDLMAEAKEESAMELDNEANAPPPEGAEGQAPKPPSSSTIAAMIDQRVGDALKEIKSLLSAPAPPKKGAVESKSSLPKKRARVTRDIDLPSRKKVAAPRKGLPKKCPSGQKEGLAFWEARRPEEGKGFPDKVWEEVREFRRQMRNLASSRDPLRIPDMYLDMFEQARKIYATEQLRENQTLGIVTAKVFISPKSYLPANIERFLCLNGKFVLAAKEPIEDIDLVYQWGQVNDAAIWRYHFRNKVDSSNFDPLLHVKSEAFLPEVPPCIQEGLDAGCEELLRQAALSRQRLSDRFNPKVTPVRSYLAANKLIVKPTDKNLGLSVFTTDEYLPALATHLREGPYEKIDPPPFQKASDLHDRLLSKLPKKGLTKEERKFICAHREINWPQFHMIPKVHKAPWGWRPIVPSHSSPTARFSKVADIALSKLLPRFPHLIRSTAEWCRAFHTGYAARDPAKKCWLITGDIVAYYTNINTETIDRSMEALLRGSRVPNARAAALAWLVKTTTHNNFFEVNKTDLFRQTNGLAMGSPCSGTVANLSLARLEKRVIHRQGILAYVRYIDDLFLLLEGTEVEVRHILREVSEACAPLTVKWDISDTHAVYLDVSVTLRVPYGFLTPGFSYRPFRKPGNQQAYLPWSSAHPMHVKKGLVMGETTRLSLLCSEESTFLEEVARFKEALCRRGYPAKALSTWTRRVPWSRRLDILGAARSTKERSADAPLRIPTTYNPIWEHIDLGKVFDRVTESWRSEWSDRPSRLSLSQNRGENLMDLLSSWNKTVLGNEPELEG